MKRLLVGLGLVALLSLPATFPGCKLLKKLPPVRICYEHPRLGRVCVDVAGQRYFREDLTPADRVEAEAWVKTQPAPPPEDP